MNHVQILRLMGSAESAPEGHVFRIARFPKPGCDESDVVGAEPVGPPFDSLDDLGNMLHLDPRDGGMNE